ncbi:hypothetical protein BC833DRAFT_586103 [Globomyces pollinis-pini]|nr:hypothetical protein BC833DRAFT_586103 [Globomyces pollinis-pini]
MAKVIKARLSNGTIINVQTNQQTTVLEVKQFISKETGESLDGMRLVYKGKMLNDDTELIDEYNIQENLHVARTRPSQSSSKSPTGNGRGENLDALMDNPMVQSMMSNPAFLQKILQSNPQLQKLIEEHPEVRENLSDPNFLQEMTKAVKNPKLMQEMMRNQDRALSNIESIPGGFNHLSSMFKSMDGPRTADPSTEEANRRMAIMLGANNKSPTDGPNTDALPNPWAPQRNKPNTASPSSALPFFGGMGNSMSPTGGIPFNPFGFNQNAMYNPSMMNMMNANSQPTVSPSTSNSSHIPQTAFLPSFQAMQQAMTLNNQQFSPSGSSNNNSVDERFKEQLAALKNMGFTNDEQNKRALLAAGGNTEAAIAYILDQ